MVYIALMLLGALFLMHGATAAHAGTPPTAGTKHAGAAIDETHDERSCPGANVHPDETCEASSTARSPILLGLLFAGAFVIVVGQSNAAGRRPSATTRTIRPPPRQLLCVELR